MNKSERRATIHELSFAVGSALVLYLFLVYALSLVFFWCGISVNKSAIPVSAAMALAFQWSTARPACLSKNLKIKISLLAVMIVVTSTIMTSLLFDRSYDGLTYHQEAVIQLASGWNPVREDLEPSAPHWLWINHYPNWAWIYAANVLATFSSIESGKSYQIILFAALFLLSFSVLGYVFSGRPMVAGFLALLVCLNPVLINQTLTYYVDGALYALLVLTCLFGIYALMRNSTQAWVLFVFSAVLLVNTKFTGIPFLILATLGFAVFLLAYKSSRSALFFIVFAVTTGLLAVLVFGYQPYIRNYLLHGHPLFPLYGNGAVDIMSENTPSSLLDRGRLQKFVLSTFSAVSVGTEPHVIRFPLLVSDMGELKASVGFDTRLSGFGFLFSGIFLLSVVGVFLCVSNSSTRLKQVAFFLVGIIALMILMHPEGWWARYVPQLWLFPVIIITCLITSGVRAKVVYGWAIALLVLANSGAISFGMLYANFRSTQEMRMELDALKKSALPVAVNFGDFTPLRHRLRQSGVNFFEVDKEGFVGCTELRIIEGSFGRARYCLDSVRR